MGLVQSPGSYGAQGPLNTAAHVLLPPPGVREAWTVLPSSCTPPSQPEATLGTPRALKEDTEAEGVWKPVEFLMEFPYNRVAGQGLDPLMLPGAPG